MDDRNIREYEVLRTEMLSVKECITNYIGFVLGGSGIASISVFGILGSGINNVGTVIKLDNMMSLFSILFLFISLLISFVLLILFYKFTSHNRFAGYCKLLSIEKHTAGIDNSTHAGIGKTIHYPTSIFGWEYVLEEFRQCTDKQDNIKAYIDIVDGLKNNDEYIDPRYNEDIKKELTKLFDDKPEKYGFIKGMSFVLKTIIGDYRAKSWAFPPYVVSMFFYLTTWFYIIGILIYFYLHRNYYPDTVLSLHSLELFIVVTISIAQGLLWRKYINNLYALMYEKKNIRSFCILLLPGRVKYLRLRSIEPRFNLQELISEAV